MNHRSIQAVVALYAAAGVLVFAGCTSETEDTAEPLEEITPQRSGRDAGFDARPSTMGDAPLSPSQSDAAAPRDAATDARIDAAPVPGALPAPTVTPSPPPKIPPPVATPCGPAGPAVFAASDATSAHRYATTDVFPAGYSSQGIVFRLAPASTSEASALLYLIGNGSNGDVLVSSVPTEGASAGYGPIATLGRIYLTQLPGTVPLVRYYRESPALRHRVSIDGSPGAGWSPEPNRFYVCPR